jgi:hypothetical protein
MQLADVEKLLNITIVGTPQEDVFEARLAAAIDQAKQYCNRDFLNDEGQLEIPKGAQMGIALIVKAMGENQNVSSQSLENMSKSFFENGTYKAALQYLKLYRRAGFR